MIEVEMHILVEILISLMLIVAGIFGIVGSLGLVKLKETMQRLHAPTKATTLGVGGVLIAAMLYYAFALGQPSVAELLITIFLFVTAPITANFIAKAHMHRNIESSELPDTQSEYDWAGYDQVPEELKKIDTK